MKLGITRWKADPLKPNPFSPVQRARKFSQVFGTTSDLNSMMTLPMGAPSAATSKKTRVVIIDGCRRSLVKSEVNEYLEAGRLIAESPC